MVLDEYLYARADREAKGQHSPSSLRAYLADPYNVRHRAEAQASINVFYDEAIAKLKKQAEGKAMDDSVFQSVLALLEALKKTDRPVVTVGFRGTQDVTPSTDELKTKEEVNYDALLDEKPELKTVADQSSGKTAILPPGDTFTAENTRTRESVILGRLRDSVQKMLGADVITLAPVTAGEAPVMEVTYHAYADGSLYLYTTTSENQFGLQPMEEVKGLLRKYEVSWVITIRPPGTDQTYESKLGSVAGSQIHYDSRPEDPSWAPYAIILYSAFNDMSKRWPATSPPAPKRWRGRRPRRRRTASPTSLPPRRNRNPRPSKQAWHLPSSSTRLRCPSTAGSPWWRATWSRASSPASTSRRTRVLASSSPSTASTTPATRSATSTGAPSARPTATTSRSMRRRRTSRPTC